MSIFSGKNRCPFVKRVFTCAVTFLMLISTLAGTAQATDETSGVPSTLSASQSLSSEVYSKRLSGQDRIQTAIAICREGWPNSAGTVIITRDDNYPDALTGTPLSRKLDAPILFTNSQNLSSETENEIARLKPSKVIILGGTGAVSQSIENRLNLTYTVQRIGGMDRYETAKKIARELGFKGKAVVTTGEDFHSALIVSPLAAYKGIPILLTLPDELPSSTSEALQFIDPSEITVIGGPGEVSNAVFNKLSNAKRIYGVDIYQTSVTAAEGLGADPSTIFFATGKNFPDALAGSALAAKSSSPILFVDEPFSAYVRQYLVSNKNNIKGIRLLGGEGVIAESTRETIMQIAADQTAEDIEENNGEVKIVDNYEQEPLQIDTAIEGGVRFEKDESHTASLEYDPDSNEAQQLTLTAEDGTVWSLVIPDHALLKCTTIKMTSLKNIVSDSLGSLKAGVLLEPDGLEFYKPVTLTMSGSGTGDNPMLLGGNHDGSKIELAMVEKNGQGISASILHFSTAYGDPLSDDEKLKQLQKQASEDYLKIRKTAIDYLKEPITVPTPPAISLRCPADHTPQDEEAIQEFINSVNRPEGEIIQKLLAAARADILLNSTVLNGSEDDDAINVSLALAERVMKKVEKLFETYYPKEEFAKAIIQAALITQRDYELLGGKGVSFVEKVADWVNIIAEKFLNELRENHDYKLIKVLFTLTREATLLGSARPDLLDDLLKALNFEVQYEATVILNGSVTYKTSGKALYIAENEAYGSYYAQGTGEYTGFDSPEPELNLKMPDPFGFETTIYNFDPCFNETIDIYINKFGKDMETYLAGPYVAYNQAVVQPSISAAYSDIATYSLRGREGQEFFKFNTPLQNLNVNAAEAHFSRELYDVVVLLTIRLVHKPQ